MVSQCTKFEVSRFTRYESIKVGAKCRKWGGLGRLGGTQGHGQCHHSIKRIDFLFDFNRNHASILYRFRDIARHLSKVADFDPPHLHLAPLEEGDPGRISRRSLASCGVVCMILRLAVLLELRLVTDRDRWTDEQTQGHV